MIQINLLPVRKMKQRAAADQQLKFFVVLLIVVFVGLISFGLIINSKVSGLQEDIALLEKEEKRLAKTLAEIKELEAKKAAIEKQTEIIDTLKKTSALTVHVLDEVANITPHERMWLTSLEQSGSSLKLSGMALDNRTIAQYLEELRNSDYIEDVTLTSTTLAKYAGKNLKAFVLSGIVKMPGAADQEADKETTKKN
ncbi:MAG: pilus assembly protein PilN [Candidatus Electrothrix sp. AR3]|nr:pilus assembly protein PilN [Candidatus Electrothrix sp. AR3]